jgi:hypothetical protein
MKLGELVSVAALALAVGSQAEASVVIDISQTGGDVVGTGGGTLDLTGLTFFESASVGGMGVVVPVDGVAIVGPDVIADVYDGASGPASFGPGFATFGSDYTGIAFGAAGSLFGLPVVVVPHGYVSGAPLLGSSTFAGETIASLGLTPGTYVYAWNSAPGIDDSLTINIGTVVPEPSTWVMMLLGFAGLGYAGYRGAREPRAA